MHVIGRINLQLHATMMKLAADIVRDFNWCSQTLSRLQHDPVLSSAFLRETSSWSLKMQYRLSPFLCWKLLWCWHVLQKQQRTICFGTYCMVSIHLYCGRVWGNRAPFITSASSFPVGLFMIPLRVIAKLLWMLCTILVLMRTSRISYFPGVGLLYLLKQSYSLTFIRSQANRAAHNLAWASVFQSSPYIFISPPNCIASLILDEMRAVVSDSKKKKNVFIMLQQIVCML